MDYQNVSSGEIISSANSQNDFSANSANASLPLFPCYISLLRSSFATPFRLLQYSSPSSSLVENLAAYTGIFISDSRLLQNLAFGRYSRMYSKTSLLVVPVNVVSSVFSIKDIALCCFSVAITLISPVFIKSIPSSKSHLN